MGSIIISYEYASDDWKNPTYYNRRYKRLINAAVYLCALVKRECSTSLEYKSGNYCYTFSDGDLRDICFAYENRLQNGKALWELWGKRFEAIERGEYPCHP
jgi:hypothetical protein